MAALQAEGRVYLKGTLTSPIKHAFRRPSRRLERLCFRRSVKRSAFKKRAQEDSDPPCRLHLKENATLVVTHPTS